MRDRPVIDIALRFARKCGADNIQAQQILARSSGETANQILRRKFVAVAIDEECVARGDRGFRATRKRVQHFQQKLRRHRVVAGRDVEKFTGCQFQATVKRGINPFARNLIQPKTGILIRDRFKKLPAAVCRLTVENDRFPIGKCLVKQ